MDNFKPQPVGLKRGVLLRLPAVTCQRTMKTLSVMHEAAKIIIILSALLGAASLVMGQESHKASAVPGFVDGGATAPSSVNPWPLALYGLGAGADVWSTRQTPPGYHRVDGSFAGPVAGPVVTAVAFASADALLQKTHHKGWAWGVRVFYALGDTLVVVRNKRMR